MKRPRTRMLWFKLWCDDFVGGTSHLQDSELGQYVRLLLAQWASHGAGVLVADAADYCKGPLSERVVSKFDTSECGMYLINRRLQSEWESATSESEGKSLARQRPDTSKRLPKTLAPKAPDTIQESTQESVQEAKKPRSQKVVKAKPVGFEAPEPKQARANPLMAGRRPELEAEALKLAASIAAREGVEALDVMAQASEYKGHSIMNPAGMFDDRLAQTLKALRKRNGSASTAYVEPPEDSWWQLRAIERKRLAGNGFDGPELDAQVDAAIDRAKAARREEHEREHGV